MTVAIAAAGRQSCSASDRGSVQSGAVVAGAAEWPTALADVDTPWQHLRGIVATADSTECGRFG